MRIRRLLRRHTIKMALTQAWTGVGRTWPRRPGRVAILCYHSVHDTLATSTATATRFEQHLDWLREHCEVVPLDAIPAIATGPRQHERPVVAITFDDGYRDNAEVALPRLVDRGLPATFFVTTGLVERDPDVLARFDGLLRGGPEEYEPMSWTQVRELVAAGMSVGDHTYRHSNLSLHPTARVEQELRRSKELLEERLDRPVATMAYPFGKDHRHVTTRDREVVRRLGYDAAVSIRHRGVGRREDPLALSRFTVLHDPVDRLAAKVFGAFDLVGALQARTPVWLGRLVSPDDFGLDAA